MRRALALMVIVLVAGGCAGGSSIPGTTGNALPSPTSPAPADPASTESAGPSNVDPTDVPVTLATPFTPAGSASPTSCVGSRDAVPRYDSGGELAWTRLPDQAGLGDAQLADIAAAPTASDVGFVAVGSLDSAPAAWTSADGLTWRRSADAPGAGQVRWTPSGWLAAGKDLWLSPDGDRWHQVGTLPKAAEAALDDAGVQHLGSCLVATGLVEVPSGNDLRTETRTWLSPDGQTWTPGGTPANPAGAAFIWGMHSTGDAIVAWGLTRTAAGDDRGASFATADGFTWRIGGGGLDGRAYMHDEIRAVTAGPAGLVAVGGAMAGEAGDGAPAAGAWTSTDGLSWTPAVFEPPGGKGPLGTVAWDGDRFLALGRPGLEQQVWMSDDGTTWTLASSAPDVARDGGVAPCTGSALCPRSHVTGVVAGPSAVVAFGQLDNETGWRSVVWAAPRATGGS